jgi:hypothetical protein
MRYETGDGCMRLEAGFVSVGANLSIRFALRRINSLHRPPSPKGDSDASNPALLGTTSPAWLNERGPVI